jgi:DNA ligase-1
MKFPRLYHKGKKGEIRFWDVYTNGNTVITEYGVKDGEKLNSFKTVTGKNIGKKNETTPEQQAEKDAQSLWTKKKDRKYSETEDEACVPLLQPMLAKEYELRRVRFPALMQPKLDGVRALAYWDDDRVVLLSRGNKEWTEFPHINKALEAWLPFDAMVDGEVYIHGVSCQTISSWTKKAKSETLTLQYHMYDMPMWAGDDTYACEERVALLKEVYNDGYPDPCLVLVETSLVENDQEVRDMETRYLELGYEGGIVRNFGAFYEFGYRSSDLLKVKTFTDSEFLVLDAREGVGKFEGCAVFICKNDRSITDEDLKELLKKRPVKWVTHTDGLKYLTFECTCAVPMEEKAKQLAEKDNYVGEDLTVKYFHRTDSDLPRFPVGLKFKHEKDQA